MFNNDFFVCPHSWCLRIKLSHEGSFEKIKKIITQNLEQSGKMRRETYRVVVSRLRPQACFCTALHVTSYHCVGLCRLNSGRQPEQHGSPGGLCCSLLLPGMHAAARCWSCRCRVGNGATHGYARGIPWHPVAIRGKPAAHPAPRTSLHRAHCSPTTDQCSLECGKNGDNHAFLVLN